MLSKLRQTKIGRGGQRRLSLFSRMTRSDPISPYRKMEGEEVSIRLPRPEERVKDAGNGGCCAASEVEKKKAKKKRSWKRVRQAALTTCRYIGMGVAHMNPAGIHSYPDYNVDPKSWNKSFSSAYKPKNMSYPHWTSTMVFSSW